MTKKENTLITELASVMTKLQDSDNATLRRAFISSTFALWQIKKNLFHLASSEIKELNSILDD